MLHGLPLRQHGDERHLVVHDDEDGLVLVVKVHLEVRGGEQLPHARHQLRAVHQRLAVVLVVDGEGGWALVRVVVRLGGDGLTDVEVLRQDLILEDGDDVLGVESGEREKQRGEKNILSCVTLSTHATMASGIRSLSSAV